MGVPPAIDPVEDEVQAGVELRGEGVPAVYVVTVVGSMVGETWAYYLIGSAVEIVLLLSIIWTARRWN